jgi:hypothetical protein
LGFLWAFFMTFRNLPISLTHSTPRYKRLGGAASERRNEHVGRIRLKVGTKKELVVRKDLVGKGVQDMKTTLFHVVFFLALGLFVTRASSDSPGALLILQK